MADESDKAKPQDSSEANPESNDSAEAESVVADIEKEIGGRDGPDPTRYGDWEKAGRCIDF